MSLISLGGMIAAIVGFVFIAALLQPAIETVAPQNYTNSLFGQYNSLQSNFSGGTFAKNISQQANDSTYGFPAARSVAQFTGFALIYGNIGSFYKTTLNAPRMMYQVFSTLLSNVPYVPIAVVGILSFVIIGYLGVLMTLKIISIISKTSVEDI